MDGHTSKGKNIENQCIYHIIFITDVVNKNKIRSVCFKIVHLKIIKRADLNYRDYLKELFKIY